MTDQLAVAFDFLYNEVAPIMIVGLSVLYFVAKEVFFAPYVLVAGWMLVCLIIGVRVVREAMRRGWLRWLWRMAKHYLTTAWIKAILGLRYIRDNLAGRVMGLFAIVNLSLFGSWIYYNVDLLRWVRSTVQLVRDCIEYIRNPPELLKAFNIWKNSIPVFGRMLNYGTVYVDYVIDGCKHGSHSVLLVIPLVSLVLAASAVAAYAIWHWYSIAVWAGWIVPPAPPGDDGDEPDDNPPSDDKKPKRTSGAKRGRAGA